MIKGSQSDLLKIYAQIQEEESASLRKRKEEIEKNLPEVLDIERKIGKLCIDLSISAFKEILDRDSHLKQIKEKITDLRIKKSELLVSHGYPMDYLSLQYRCDKCNDTGFIGTEKCICYKQKLVSLYYKNSDLKDMIRDNNFDHFSLSCYSTKREGDEPLSARKNIENIVSKTMSFIKDFTSSKDNFLFYGNSGTGKTFLSHCIAKELLDKGFLVIYRTSDDLIQNLKRIRFEGDEMLEDLILNCDLLIIDDLGSEQVNEFSKTELFNLLNKKLLRGKKMLVSTNFSLEDILKNYSERMSSRLIGNFTLCKFYGDDIRIKQNFAKGK